ncbi:hypothetical protein LNKW23_44780 [Paralimibaculum aggregatum]|uniref:Curli production assembly/transport component CsgG n=1 Tax=Paralimibaculum aggregatum TaxID=3036245 RepID=A0ABQ6LT52_9RHOB|nr:hypothetical protein [Limibaculum sp. NKW23]GMG85260.1 hypothetical protein LNKW23_44780 [Limibaculum sp. NKW23]
MWIKTLAAGIAGLALFGGTFTATPSVAQDIPNVLVMTEDFDQDTVPRNSRVQRNILSGLNDRLNQRGYRVFDETALGIDGYQSTTVQGRSRRTPDELIIVARTANQPIDIIVNYEVFASVEKTDFASFVKMRITGRVLDPDSGRFVGSFEVESPETFRLPVNCPRECLLEKLSTKGRDMGVELSSVLADKLDDFFGRHGGGQVTTGGGGYAAPATGGAQTGGVGFERTYTLVFDECSPEIRLDFEPYLVIFEGYLNHRPDVCSSTSCKMQYTSTIAPGKLHRNLEKMLVHSNHRGRVGVDGATYTVSCVPVRRRHPVQLDPGNW